jgi:trk system potassium uptake protein TrkA
MAKLLTVIGMGLFGTTVAREATAIGHEVLGIDKDERRVDDVRNDIAHVVRADATDLQALVPLGVKDSHTAIVAVGDELVNIMITMNLMTLGVKNIICRAISEMHASVLERLGVARVVLPEREEGIKLAHTFFAPPQVSEYMDLTPDHGISKIQASGALVGKSLHDTGLSWKFGLHVLILVRRNEVVINPSGLTIKLEKGDTLVVVGEDERLEKISELYTTMEVSAEERPLAGKTNARHPR